MSLRLVVDLRLWWWWWWGVEEEEGRGEYTEKLGQDYVVGPHSNTTRA